MSIELSERSPAQPAAFEGNASKPSRMAAGEREGQTGEDKEDRRRDGMSGATPSVAAGKQPREAAGPVDAVKGERVVDMREIAPRIRHTLIFQLFEHLGEVSSLQLIVDHDPRPLRLQLEAKHGSRCRWTYLEQGPDIWRVRLRQSDGGGGP